MTSSAFDVLDFSADNLYTALANEHVTAAEIGRQGRARYLHRYLAGLDARTVVVERDYTDRDYLDDYAAYYVRCFARYDRRCKRLHFFRGEPLTAESLLHTVRGGISDQEEATFRQAYLGFVVARPLPQAVVGRTVLRTWDSDGGRRNYTCVGGYTANLFGIELSVPSLAFQEQDTVLAACATVSLWSCFQRTAELFGTATPTPAEITRAASLSGHYGRPIPSHGLNAVEVCKAIQAAGLEPEIFDVTEELPVVSLVCGYLAMGLPVILGVDVEGMGGHAITLVGYSRRPRAQRAREVAGGTWCIPMTGLYVDSLYGHDDQIGPFSRLVVKPGSTVGKTTYPVVFESSWVSTAGRVLSLFPRVIIVPLYHKVRLTFIDVQQWLTSLTEVVQLVIQPSAQSALSQGGGTPSPAVPSFRWDIRLTLSNDYKKALRSQRAPADAVAEELLVMHHPRFAWCATLNAGDAKMVELLFDATDMSRSYPIYHIRWERQDFAFGVRRILEAPSLRSLLSERLRPRFIQHLRDTIDRQFPSSDPGLSSSAAPSQ